MTDSRDHEGTGMSVRSEGQERERSEGQEGMQR
jgi:hypothetical protein